ncbi:succinate-semialdehyde dehydrogenase [Collinsella sp. An271]|nr:succinate-semialdehyde dehydrogenase [Collinsella sp. An271]
MAEFIERARVAQAEFETYSQEEVDRAVRAIGKAVFDAAEPLAKLAVEETRMGRYEDKIAKNSGKTKITWDRLKGVKSRGIIARHEDEGIVEVAKPMGVIGCIPPTTNPTMTPAHNAMCALKGGNALLISPHPRAKKTGVETVRIMREALEAMGAPADLIQIIPDPTLEISSLVMSMCDCTIATGGPGMVKAVYSSGKPAFGVGAGNVQTIVDTDADLELSAQQIVRSRTYDNGVLCTCEQCIHVQEDIYGEMVRLFQQEGAFYISEQADVDALRAALFPNGAINKDAVGASPQFIGSLAGLDVPEDAKLLMVKVDAYGADELLCKEKLCPVMCVASYGTWEEGVANAKTNLLHEGAGHSAIVRSHTAEHVDYAGEQLPVSRIGVNMIGSSGLGGAFDNGLNPTATLGCGSWGNNSISENLWWHHLVNIARIAVALPDVQVPSDEEVWGE